MRNQRRHQGLGFDILRIQHQGSFEIYGVDQAREEVMCYRLLKRGKERKDEPLRAPRVYPAKNLVLARNNRASTASFVAKFGINRQDWTAFSTNDLELVTEREGGLLRVRNLSNYRPMIKRNGTDGETELKLRKRYAGSDDRKGGVRERITA